MSVFSFIASGSGHGDGEPTSFELPRCKHLPKGNLPKAILVNPAPAPQNGVLAVLRAVNVAAWCQRASGDCVKLSLGKPVIVCVGDELVFGEPSSATPPEDADIAYLLCAQEEATHEAPPKNEPVPAAAHPGPSLIGCPAAANEPPARLHGASSGAIHHTLHIKADPYLATCGSIGPMPPAPGPQLADSMAAATVTAGAPDAAAAGTSDPAAAHNQQPQQPAAVHSAADTAATMQTGEADTELAPGMPADDPGADAADSNMPADDGAAVEAAGPDVPMDAPQPQPDVGPAPTLTPARVAEPSTGVKPPPPVAADAATPFAHTPIGAGGLPPVALPFAADAGAGAQADMSAPATRPSGPGKTPAGRSDLLADCEAVIAGVTSIVFPQSNGDGAPKLHLAGAELSRLWQEELEDLRRRCAMPRTTIGVVGNTGAGKSSLLNALLGEEDILPTNGMRASTGCPIEVAYDKSHMYRASVEFLSKEEWLSYLVRLLDDLTGEDGELKISSGDSCNTRTEAGAAQAMLEAVYGRDVIRAPGLSYDKLQRHTSSVTRLLGTTMEVKNADKKHFRREIGKYVDSHNQAGNAQAWPIVKVCKIQHNWKLLAGGAVLVDLPGVRDANEARGAVAEAYMRKLDAVWVVADITRAVDDKTAKDLLGSSFRRRMVMDGQMDALTFVCTKTDNIQISGTRDAMSDAEICRRSGTSQEEFRRLDEQIQGLLDAEVQAGKAKSKAAKQATLAAGRRQRGYTTVEVIRNCIADSCRAGGVALPEGLRDIMAGVVRPKDDKKGRKKARLGDGSRGSRQSDDEDEDEDDEEISDEDSDDEEASSEEQEDSDGEYDPEEEDADGSEREREASGSEDDDQASGDDDDDEVEEEEEEEEEDRSRGRRTGGKRKRAAKSSKGRKGSKSEKANARLLAKYRSKTVPELMAALREAVQKLKTAQAEFVAHTRERKAAAEQLKELSHALVKPQLRMASICGLARNSFSRDRLQQDFQDGISEMLAPAGTAGHDGSSDGDSPDGAAAGAASAAAAARQRAPDHLREIKLPVFCVSARDFLKLEGRTRRDGKASAFTKTDQTEIPQLRHHVRETADRGRIRAQQELVRGLFQLIDSMGNTLLSEALDKSPAVAMAVRQVVEAGLESMRSRLMQLWEQQAEVMKAECLDHGLTPSLSDGATEAHAKAESTARGWGMRLRWATYKATVRRDGVYTSGAAGSIAFNSDLTAPIFDAIKLVWLDVFGCRVPSIIGAVEKMSLGELDGFVTLVHAQLTKMGIHLDQLGSLHQQVRRDEQRKLRAALEALAGKVDEVSKDLSRDVVEPFIQTEMQGAYSAAAAERGSGCYMRMKAIVEQRARQMAGTALYEAADALEQEVLKLLDYVDTSLVTALDALVKGTGARFSLLWDHVPSSYGLRYAAAQSLQQLAVRASDLCRKAHVEVHPPFQMPVQQQLSPQPSESPAGSLGGQDEPDEDMEEPEEEEEEEDEGAAASEGEGVLPPGFGGEGPQPADGGAAFSSAHCPAGAAGAMQVGPSVVQPSMAGPQNLASLLLQQQQQHPGLQGCQGMSSLHNHQQLPLQHLGMLVKQERFEGLQGCLGAVVGPALQLVPHGHVAAATGTTTLQQQQQLLQQQLVQHLMHQHHQQLMQQQQHLQQQQLLQHQQHLAMGQQVGPMMQLLAADGEVQAGATAAEDAVMQVELNLIVPGAAGKAGSDQPDALRAAAAYTGA